MTTADTPDQAQSRKACAGRCAFLGFGAPIAFFAGLGFILPTDNYVLLLAWLLLLIIHGIAAFYFGGLALDGATSSQIAELKWRVRLGKTAAALSMCFIGALSLLFSVFILRDGHPSTCRNTLTNVYHALLTAQDSPEGNFPPLSAESGQLTIAHAVAAAEAVSLTTGLRCPSVANTMRYASGRTDVEDEQGDAHFF